MSVTLHVCPKDPPQPWERFCREKPPFSIALDGYVSAGPRFEASGPYLNLNHHEEVDRLATRATCAQVLMALRQGLRDCFRDGSGFRAEVFVGDCDEDVCLSWFLLEQCHMAEPALNPQLNRLVQLEDFLDSTAGAYPFPADLPVLQELAWVFEPYRRFRTSGEIDRRDAESFRGVITDVGNRIWRHLSGAGGSIPLDTQYTRVGGGEGWALVEEVGSDARTGMFADGIRAYVSARARPGGRWSYTVGRMSPFIPFDVPGLLALLNEVEQAGEDRWGGGNTIGGSPRVGGSELPPAEVERIVNEFLAMTGGGP